MYRLSAANGSLLKKTDTQHGACPLSDIGIPMLRCSVLGYRSRTLKLIDTDIGTILMQEDVIAIEAAGQSGH